MENSSFHALLELCGSIIVFFMGVFVRSHNGRIEKIEKDAEYTGKDLSAHKLDSEKRYAKEETMQASLSRLHNRLDELPREIRDMIVHMSSRNGSGS